MNLNKAYLLGTFFAFLCVAFNNPLNAQQDTIFKINGEKIACKIVEVGTKAISFKRADNIDGPMFIENKPDIAFIKFKGGQKEEITKAGENVVSNNASTEMNTATNTQANTTPVTNGKGPISDEHKIIYDGNGYFVNGQEISRKNVDRLLSRSNNPAVKIPFKTAKTTKTVQKIIKITSFPSTIAGIIGCFPTFGKVIDQSRTPEGVSFGAWAAAGSTFLGTISLPITSKILKKKTTKLYDKTIDIYNVGKK